MDYGRLFYSVTVTKHNQATNKYTEYTQCNFIVLTTSYFLISLLSSHFSPSSSNLITFLKIEPYLCENESLFLCLAAIWFSKTCMSGKTLAQIWQTMKVTAAAGGFLSVASLVLMIVRSNASRIFVCGYQP